MIAALFTFDLLSVPLPESALRSRTSAHSRAHTHNSFPKSRHFQVATSREIRSHAAALVAAATVGAPDVNSAAQHALVEAAALVKSKVNAVVKVWML